MPRRFRWRARTAFRSWCFLSSKAAGLPRFSAAAGDTRSSESRIRPRQGEKVMPEDSLLTDLRRRMDGALEVLRKECGGLGTGRPPAVLLEPITVAAYGGTMPISQVAN